MKGLLKLATAFVSGMCVLTGNSIQAQTTFFDTRIAFLSAAAGLSTVGFEGVAPSGSYNAFGKGGAYSDQGVTFQAAASQDLYIYSASYIANYNLGAGDYLVCGNASPASLTITLPANVTAIGFDLGTLTDTGSAVLVTLANGFTQTLNANYPNLDFYGVTSVSPISSISLLVTGGNRRDTINLDTFQFGRISASVPAPSSLFCLAFGGTALLFRVRRRT